MKRKLFLSIVGLFALGLTLFYVRARFLLVELSYQVSERRALKTELEQEKRELSLELSTLKSPNRIERIAKKKLGLSRSKENVSLVVVESKQ